MKLTAAQRRGLIAVRDGKAIREYTHKGNSIQCQDVGASTLYRLEEMKLIREARSTTKWQTRFRLELTPAGEAELPKIPTGPFYVYKRVKRQGWQLIGEFEQIGIAEAAARKLCPRDRQPYTEPGHGLERAFFGTASGGGFRAMITTKPHASESE